LFIDYHRKFLPNASSWKTARKTSSPRKSIMFQTFITILPLVLLGLTLLGVFGVKLFTDFYVQVALNTAWIFYCIMVGSYIFAGIFFALTVFRFWQRAKSEEAPVKPSRDNR
jgi:hypothetical protein